MENSSDDLCNDLLGCLDTLVPDGMKEVQSPKKWKGEERSDREDQGCHHVGEVVAYRCTWGFAHAVNAPKYIIQKPMSA